jgi:DNA polymerase III subunit gamma/tau
MSDSIDPPAPDLEDLADPTGAVEYRVLARKYRPQSFEDLLGQDALVRTLRNAFAQNRIHHAFVLTGVRGVGKTTTARIIAKGLNCIGPDGTGGPTMQPCGVCDNCRSIAEDRHVDVLEMDAASRTGIDDVREIIESVRYRPVSARYKVFIVDEVHMLSKNAFNALLKTLEEPPEHVKFIFATTEIRKVPVTVLSRCQRFDLKRIDASVLMTLFNKVTAAEKIAVEDEALLMIARAADGSARDGLSILDQAMALSDGQTVTTALVREMLGVVDRARIYDLFEAVMAGRIADALAELRGMYDNGADPVVIIQDLMELTHGVTRMKAAPQAALANDLSETERDRGRKLAETLGVPSLTRAWQMLAKGLGEVQSAPIAISAVEMVLIRLAHAAELPDPASLVRILTESADAPAPAGTAPAAQAPGARMQATSQPEKPEPAAAVTPAAPSDDQPDEPPPASPEDYGAVDNRDVISRIPVTFEDVVNLFKDRGEPFLASQLEKDVHCVSLAPGTLEIRPERGFDIRNIGQVQQHLARWTGRPWEVALSEAAGDPTLREQKQAAQDARTEQAATDPVVSKVLALFPGSVIEEITAPAIETAVEVGTAAADDDRDDGPDDDFAEDIGEPPRADQAGG